MWIIIVRERAKTTPFVPVPFLRSHACDTGNSSDSTCAPSCRCKYRLYTFRSEDHCSYILSWYIPNITLSDLNWFDRVIVVEWQKLWFRNPLTKQNLFGSQRRWCQLFPSKDFYDWISFRRFLSFQPAPKQKFALADGRDVRQYVVKK